MQTKKLRNDNLSRLLIAISILGLGFSFGLLVSKDINLSDEINSVDLASLFATFFLAFYISHIIERNKEADKGVKDLFLRRIDQLIETICDFRKEIESENIEYFITTRLGRNLRKGINELFSLSSKVRITVDEELKIKIVGLARDLVKESTYTSPISKRESSLKVDIEIKDDQIIISEDKKRIISHILDSLDSEFFLLQVDIYEK